MKRRRTAWIALLALIPHGESLAARIPDWAQPVVEEAPPPPEGVSPVEERVLFEETRETVREDGTILIRYRLATQALTSRSSRFKIGSFYFDERRAVKSTKAWHILPGERAKMSREATADITLGDAFLTDSKIRAVPVEGVKKGSIVLFEFQAVETPYILPRTHVFANSAPLVRQRYEIEVPAGWNLEWDWPRGDGVEPEIAGGVHAWELNDRPAPAEEPMAPPVQEQWPILALNLLPPEGAQVQPMALRDWAAFSQWYEGLAGDRHKVDETLLAAMKNAFAGAGEDFPSRITAAGRYVRDKVRYVAVELGVGAIQPRPASDTHSNLYGDCKDKGTLFRALLSEQRRNSYPVLVNLSYEGTLSSSVPAWGFDHFVVAVPIPEEETLPEAFAPALMKTEDQGRLLIVDTTDERVAVGSISASLSGKKALLVDGKRGRLVTLPGRNPRAHRIERRFTGELNGSGNMTIERQSSYYGAFASSARASYSASSADRRKGVESRVLGIWPDAVALGYEAEYETDGGAYLETIGSRSRTSPAAGEARRIDVFPGLRGDLARTSLSKREIAVVYPNPQTIRYDVTYKGLPHGLQAPEPAEESGEGWKVRTALELRDGELIASCEIVQEKTRFEPSEFEELRRFWNAVSRASSASLKIHG